MQAGYRDFIELEQAALADPAQRDFWRGQLDGAQALSLRARCRATRRTNGWIIWRSRSPSNWRRRCARARRDVPLKSVLLAHLRALQALSAARRADVDGDARAA